MGFFVRDMVHGGGNWFGFGGLKRGRRGREEEEEEEEEEERERENNK